MVWFNQTLRVSARVRAWGSNGGRARFVLKVEHPNLSGWHGTPPHPMLLNFT